jgi:hypothetical protein
MKLCFAKTWDEVHGAQPKLNAFWLDAFESVMISVVNGQPVYAQRWMLNPSENDLRKVSCLRCEEDEMQVRNLFPCPFW